MVPERSWEIPTTSRNVGLLRASGPAEMAGAVGSPELTGERCREECNGERVRRRRREIGTGNIRIGAVGQGRAIVGLGMRVPVLTVKVGIPRPSPMPRAEELGGGTVRVVATVASTLAGALGVLRRGEVAMVGHLLRSTRQRAQKTFWRVWG